MKSDNTSMGKTQKGIVSKLAGMLLLLGLLLGLASNSLAGEVQVAVASNFIKPMEQIAEAFKASNGHHAHLSFGSSGKFAAQINHGAPFEVFLSADTRNPEKLIAAGLATKDSRFTYAYGKLVLWSLQDAMVDSQAKVLRTNRFRHLALASPELAPYGTAAIQVLDKLQLRQKLDGRILYSLPFVVQPLQNAFEAIDSHLLEAAATLRASPLDTFLSVAIPLARPGFLTATILGFAHTVGEFGVVLMVGGNIPECTRVISMQIYNHVEAGSYLQAHWLAGGMLVFSFLVMLALYTLNSNPLNKR